jgi:transcriptional regulator with XRE-family HTH domain
MQYPVPGRAAQLPWRLSFAAASSFGGSLCFNMAMNVLTHTLPITLQQARRLSQLELSMRLGVSQRHVSYVESSRAKPSRELLLAWLQELDAPLAVRNAAMLQAGYAPAYSTMPLSEPAMAHAHQAMLHLLATHDPMPALLIDAQWQVLRMNRGAEWLAGMLLPWLADVPEGTPLNMLDLLAHPDGLCRHILNLAEVGPVLLSQFRADAVAHPVLRPRVEAFAAMLSARLGPHSLHAAWPHDIAPVLTSRFASPFGELAFFNMITTFGTPQDITLASLRVEHMFAADEATRAALLAQV